MEIALLAAHMIGDYCAQTDAMAARKLIDWRVRTIHVVCYTFCFVPFLWLWNVDLGSALWFLGALFVTHWLTDCRRWASGEKWAPKPIMVDQAIHLATLAVLFKLFLFQ